MDPIVGGALVNGAASLIGNLFGSKSTDKTNKANKEIAQMNNEWSERMMQKQMDYNTDMWNKQNAYNDPSKQLERLKAAGINPAFALSNVSTGLASGGNSVGLPSPSGATMQSYRPDFSGIGSAMQTAAQQMLQRDKQAAEIRFIDKQADWYDAQAKAQISKAYAEAEGHTAKTYYQNIMNSWAPKQFSADWMNKIRQGWQLETQIQNTIKSGLLLDKDIASYDSRTNGNLSEQLSRIALNYVQGDLTKQKLKTEIATLKGINLSNKEKEAIFDYVVDKADADRFKGYTPWSIGADLLHGVGKRINKLFGW